jgi:hypothetical protein
LQRSILKATNKDKNTPGEEILECGYSQPSVPLHLLPRHHAFDVSSVIGTG